MAGPSSSGKTTFSRRLAVQLLANGIRPIALEMDDYFVDREQTPRDEQGNYDFEVLEALDLKLFNEHLLQLMAGEEVTLPKFNFVSGKRETGPTIQLAADQILLVEGIHGLNPRLVPNIPPERIFRIYVSGADTAQHRPPQPGAHHRHAPDAPHRARRPHARLLGRRDHRPLGKRAPRRARLHLPLPGERRRHVQLGAGLRAVGAQAAGRAAAAADQSRASRATSKPSGCSRSCNGSSRSRSTRSPTTRSCGSSWAGAIWSGSGRNRKGRPSTISLCGRRTIPRR